MNAYDSDIAKKCSRPAFRRGADAWLLRSAMLLIAWVFALQGLATATKRTWPPIHYHLDGAASSAQPMSRPAVPSPFEPDALGAPRAGLYGLSAVRPEHRQARHGEMHGAASAVAAHASSVALAPGRSHAHPHTQRHRHPRDAQVDGPSDRRPGTAAAPRATVPAGDPMHRHAAISAHHHAPGRADVVIIDDASERNAAAATAAAPEHDWSMPLMADEPAALRREAVSSMPGTSARALRRIVPLERPPRG